MIVFSEFAHKFVYYIYMVSQSMTVALFSQCDIFKWFIQFWSSVSYTKLFHRYHVTQKFYRLSISLYEKK